MRTFPENFEYLRFTKAKYDTLKVTEDPAETGRVITIPVKNIQVFGEHPLAKDENDKALRWHPALGAVVDGWMVFRGAFLSRYKIVKYIDDPMNSGELKEVEGLNSGMGNEVMNVYPFEGEIEEPHAWVTWYIAARSFELQVE